MWAGLTSVPRKLAHTLLPTFKCIKVPESSKEEQSTNYIHTGGVWQVDDLMSCGTTLLQGKKTNFEVTPTNVSIPQGKINYITIVGRNLVKRLACSIKSSKDILIFDCLAVKWLFHRFILKHLIFFAEIYINN